MGSYREGDYVWVEQQRPGEFDVAIGGRLVAILNGGQRVRLVDDEQREVEVESSRLRFMNVGSIQNVDDMIKLNDLSEPSLLRNLLVRYKQGLIYTYTGSILIAVNPFTMLPIYTAETMKAYNERKIGERPPHIYAIADNAYTNMKRFRRNQCVIVSGESGAGKTESTKLILQYLANVSGQHTWIEQQVIEANPILEAFGNAKTVRNDNSSRFGKYIEIHFSSNGTIESASIEHYLLEKSRLISQASDERNYHIFYCMCAGLSQEDRRRLQLLDAVHYAYLISGGAVQLDGRDDAQEFANIRSAMKVLTFTDDEVWNIFSLLTALLYIGNIRHTKKVVDTVDTIEIRDSRELSIVAELLQVPVSALSDAFTTRTLITRSESVTSLLSPESYTDVKDAFVKGVYGRLFVWIVNKINAVIFKQTVRRDRFSIGLLDIFGFENFASNGFEQLCINYANENLQQFFVNHVFKLEQEQYELEHINWQRIRFIDNQESLDMIALRPMNILALIDEESRFPQGTDLSLLAKLHAAHASNVNYLKPKSDARVVFGINHYAGVVFYDVKNFLEKNRDSFSNDLLTLVQSSKSSFVKTLFEDDIAMGVETRKRIPTLSVQFKKSLESLMRTLSGCQPFFVRCIKPNDYKLALSFDRPLCVRQLRYSGMMETIRIRRSGYPIRHRFADFVARYRALSQKVWRVPFSKINDHAAAATLILKQTLGDSDYQLGSARVFLKDEHDVILEQARDRALRGFAVTIQRHYRGFRDRKRYRTVKTAAQTLQRFWRAYVERVRYVRIRRGLFRLQAVLRARIISRNFASTRHTFMEIQRYSRGFLARRNVRTRQGAAIQIQSAVRRHLAQRKLSKLRNERDIIAEAHKLREKTEIELRRHNNAQVAKQKADEWLEEYLKSKELEMKAAEARHKAERDKLVRAIIDQSLKKKAPLSEAAIVAQIANADSTDSASIASMSEYGRPDVARSYRLPVPAGDDDKELYEYSFTKFAATYFQDSSLCTFSRRLLKHPLLYLSEEGDQLAALAVYVTILRFMGDLPDPVKTPKDNTPMMTRIYGTIGKKVGRNELDKLKKLTDEFEKDPNNSVMFGTSKRKRLNLLSNTLRKASKISGLIGDSAAQSGSTSDGAEQSNGVDNSVEQRLLDEVFIANRSMNKLEKIHFIIGSGILRPELRDEIYSQLCKQLSQNPSSNSRTYGWILMSLCLGCFAPSDRLRKYLLRFVSEGPSGFGPHCEQQLKRTLMNGTRSQPPAYVELQAIRSKKPILLSVALTNASTLSLVADSATTARELCQQVAAQLSLVEQFGFSLFIALQDKVSSLGFGNDHLMDAISQCEQYAKEHGIRERQAPWKLHFRKEIFAPWPCISEDSIAIKLAYCQIVRGLKTGDYRCETERDLAQIVAQLYFVDHSTEPTNERLRTILPTYLPEQITSQLNSSQMQYWITMVTQAFQQAPFVRQRSTQLNVMKEVVSYAKSKWPLLFSRFYEAKRLPLHENQAASDTLARANASLSVLVGNRADQKDIPVDVIIAINWTGFFLVDEREHVLLEITYPEIAGISCVNMQLNERSGMPGPRFNVVKLLTVRNQNFVFAAPNAEDIKDLVVFFLEGLKNRSRYVVTLQDYSPPPQTDPTQPLMMTTRKGHLIVLDADSATYSLMQNTSSQYRSGRNVATGQSGHFLLDGVYILPCISLPSPEIVAHFTSLNNKAIQSFYMKNLHDSQVANPGAPKDESNRIVADSSATNGATDEMGSRYTLERYATQYFGAPLRPGTVSKALGSAFSNGKNSAAQLEPLWRHSQEPLTKPLLLKLQNRGDLVEAAIAAFNNIRAYMGDQTGSGARKSGDKTLIQPIFATMLSNEALKDEVYCQIIKQLTANMSRGSEERGWELLWLATGICAPSAILLQEVIRFLKSVRLPIAAECLNRLYKTMRSGQRKYGPHMVEIDAVQARTTQIMHKVFFPDATNEPFEVDSTTRTRDLVHAIAQHLTLRSSSGFSLFVKTINRVFSVPEAEYVFDYLTQLHEWASANGAYANLKDQENASLMYQIFFMKKLWIDTVPGVDRVADSRFLYYQELPKFLRGYHHCSLDTAAQLASLVYRVTYGDDSFGLEQLNAKMLADLLPADLIPKLEIADWTARIVAEFEMSSSIKGDDAKVEFLKVLYSLPSFGSAFFDVKQTSLADLPMQVLIMINQNGVTVIEPSSKQVLVTYPFRTISNWASGLNWFYMTVAAVNGSKLVCETPLGYKMDDLLTSYMQLIVNTSPSQQQTQPTQNAPPNGDSALSRDNAAENAKRSSVHNAAGRVFFSTKSNGRSGSQLVEVTSSSL